MDSSNSDNLSQPRYNINDDWDFSNWDVNLNEWVLFPENDQIYDDFLPKSNPVSAQRSGFDHATVSHNVAGEAEQNMSLNEWEMLGPKSFDIAEMLSNDPDLDPLSTTYDLPLEPPAVVPPFEPLTPDALEIILQQGPPPPRSDPSPDRVPLVVPDWLDRQVTVDDLPHRNQEGPKPANSPNLTEKDISFDIGQSLADNTLATPQEPLGMETQKLLVALRGEVDEISSFSPGQSLESLFDGNMLWHINDKATFSAYSKSVSTIAVKRLATTRAETEAQPNGIVVPAMDAVHLDTFIDQRRPARETKGLADVDRETLTIAWRCAYWLTILLRWDSNEIYLSQAGRDAMPLVDAKNLVLELAYSIAHRVQVLIKKLCHRAAKSLARLDESLDPVTICCALWIVFSATHKFGNTISGQRA
ncbi:hypothetical protein FDENT_4092 [Fusarium denticulatum]|uniref:Uncharacterized protein n=1 Tax=Fusarium denticulatum TaxID=48507 RepID=A0A8H5UPQ0_9HYPO|nr:hypothetical protein FDENT_4092 [Fusarium denticulatum]